MNKSMNKTMCSFLYAAYLCAPVLAQEPAAEIPPPKPAADESAFGAKIARTMTDLATSTPEQRKPVRLLFYGQSITRQPWSDAIGKRLKKEFPNADFSFDNRALGGFGAERLIRTAVADLYPPYPDLVIFHVYGGVGGELEEIIANIRKLTTAEIVLATHHIDAGPDSAQKANDQSSQLIRDLAAKYDCELVEVREEWRQYMADNQLKPQDLLRDTVHLNDKGCKLMEALVWRHLRYNKNFANPHADEIKTVPVQPAADGSIKVAFTGNRVDLVQNPTDKPRGTARILIDGQPPSANPKAYTITKPSTANEVWWPAVYTVGIQTMPLLEDWTLKFTEVSEDAKKFKYQVTGSKTGPDGEGSSEGKFISNSGRVVIDPKDFGIEWAQQVSKKPCPPGFEIKWSVVPMFQDIYNPKQDRPTVVQLIENGPHTLEIIPNGDGVVPVNAIRVFQPTIQ